MEAVTALWDKGGWSEAQSGVALDKSANLHALTRTSDRTINTLWRVLVKAYDRGALKQLQLAMDQLRLDKDTFGQSIRILTASAQEKRSPN